MKFLELKEAARQRTRFLGFQFALVAVLALGLTFVLAFAVGLFLSMGEAGILRALDILSHPPRFSSLCWVAALHAAYLVPLTLRANRGRMERALEALRGELEARKERDPTHDPAHRKLVNVVEEMALAAGMPAPRVRLWSRYAAINSVTLGYGPSDATIYMSRLAVDGLSRDELQALIAYSMGQIINGDMALNMRLASYVQWFRVAPRLAFWLMRVPLRNAKGQEISAGRLLFWLLLSFPAGLALLLATWPTLVAAEFLQSRVHLERQRLTDASVIQFTREQQPLEDLLLKALAYTSSARLMRGLSGLMDDFAHCCFYTPRVLGFVAPQGSIAARLRTLNPGMQVPEYPSDELDQIRQEVRERVASAKLLRAQRHL